LHNEFVCHGYLAHRSAKLIDCNNKYQNKGHRFSLPNYGMPIQPLPAQLGGIGILLSGGILLTVSLILLMVLGGSSWHAPPQLAPGETLLTKLAATGSGV
jgi:hypothetical protein